MVCLVLALWRQQMLGLCLLRLLADKQVQVLLPHWVRILKRAQTWAWLIPLLLRGLHQTGPVLLLQRLDLFLQLPRQPVRLV